MCNITLLNVYSLDSGETYFFLLFFFKPFLQNNLHNIPTHPVYNYMTITSDSCFYTVWKNKTIVQAYFFAVSIQINLYIFSFSNRSRRQNIQTNRQQNMQHPEHKVSDDYPGWIGCFLVVVFFFLFPIPFGLHRYSLVDSTRLDDTLGPPLNDYTHALLYK